MKNAYVVEDGAATVKLTQGMSMHVAESALTILAPYRWYAYRSRYSHAWYAQTNVRLPDGHRSGLLAHRLLCGLDFGDPREVDHVDHDGLNNLPSNLRVTDAGGNAYNKQGKRSHRRGETPTSRFPGVHWNKTMSKWRVQIQLAGRHVSLGYYGVEENAADAYFRAKRVRDAGGTPEEVRATQMQDWRRARRRNMEKRRMTRGSLVQGRRCPRSHIMRDRQRQGW